MTAKVSPYDPENNLNRQMPQPYESRDNSDNAKNNEVTWVRNHIKLRKRVSYTSYDDTDNKDQSKQEVDRPSSDVKVIFSEHEYSVPTDAFGKIEFVNFGGNIGKFVRVDSKADMSTIIELMTTVWGLHTPNLLISVTGGADNCNIKPHLRDVFQCELMKAVNSTGAWIITGGTHTGVTKHVGEAVNSYGLTSTDAKSVVAIGIAPWGVVQNREDLKNEQGSWPAKYHIKEQHNPMESFLDPNHSHFILVDDGTQEKYNTEISFRTELERKISEKTNDRVDDQINMGSVVSSVSTLLLVLEGGPGTLATVENALEKNTPAVIFKGSGRAADVLAYAFKNAIDVEHDQGEYTKRMYPALQDEIKKQLVKIKFCPEKDIDENIKRIEKCLNYSNLIYICKWNSESGALDMDVAMLKALLKVKKNKPIDLLGLALAWNRIDIAKSEILTDEIRLPPSKFDGIMLLAILMNRVKFVELLLENGVQLKRFMTLQKLQQLYNECNKKIHLKDVRQLIQNLLGDFYSLDKDLVEKKQTDVAQDCTQDSKAEGQNCNFENPERELLIWSVINTRQELAELFWLHGQDPMAAALVASALYSAMSDRTDDAELITQLRENSSKFTTLAIGVLKESHNKDEMKTQHLLIRNVSQWGKTSCILIAVHAQNKEFLSQTQCQELFRSIWRGQLKQENDSLTLLICTMIPVLIPRLVKFKENVQVKKKPVDAKIKKLQMMLMFQINQNSNKPPRTTKTKASSSFQNAQGTKTVKRSNIANICSFYQAPVVVFCQNLIFYLVFLTLYSSILIFKLEEKLSLEEIILIVWVVTLVAEEIRQASTRSSLTLQKSYITNGWNQIDVFMILLFLIGIILRLIPHPGTLEAARVVLGVDLITFFMRLLHICCVHRELGPKLSMIILTLQSLTYFFVILMVFTVAYAISSHAILYPNAELSLDTLIAIFRRPYWNIYGELMLEEIEGYKDCTNDAELYRNGTYFRCPSVSGKYFGPVLMALYMLMCNILLLNLLIVMFGETYQKVQNNIDMYWNLQLLSLIDEYYSRPILAPPMICIVHVWRLIKWMARTCRSTSFALGDNQPNSSAPGQRQPNSPTPGQSRSNSSKPGESQPSSSAPEKLLPNASGQSHQNSSTPRQSAFYNDSLDEKKLRAWENAIADTLYRERRLADQNSATFSVQSTAVQVEQLVKKFDKLQKQQQLLTETIEEVQLDSIDNELTNIRVKNMEKQLQWIIKALSERNFGDKIDIPEVTDPTDYGYGTESPLMVDCVPESTTP